MGSRSSRSSTETSPSIWRRSKPTRAAWWSFVTRCKDIAVGRGTPPNKLLKLTGGRHPGFPGFNVIAGGPGRVAGAFGQSGGTRRALAILLLPFAAKESAMTPTLQALGIDKLSVDEQLA